MPGPRRGILSNTPSNGKQLRQGMLDFGHRGVDAVKVLMHLPKSFQKVWVKMCRLCSVVPV